MASLLVQPALAAPLISPPARPTIAAGENHSVVIAPDGKPYAIGNESNGATGQDGFGDVDDLSPMKGLPGQVKAVTVAAGFEVTVAVGSDGKPYATGFQPAAGPTVSTFQPIPGLPNGVTATAVAAGAQFQLVLGSDGTVYGAGRNVEGQLTGAGTRTSLTPLTGLADGRRAIAIAAGNQHTVVLDDLGRVYGTGLAAQGQITGSSDRTTLTEFSDMPAGIRFTDIAAGAAHTVMLGSDGRAYAVGQNADGQLGTGDNVTPQRRPVRMLRSSGAVDVAAGKNHSLVVTSGGGLLGTGRGLSGQIGGSASLNVLRPLTALSSETGPSPIVEAAGGAIHTLTVDADGVVRGAGSNDHGQAAGDDTLLNSPTLTPMLNQPTYSIAAPKVSGTAKVGTQLKVSNGSWWPAASSYSYQWERAGGGGFVSNSSTYTPALADAGKTLYVRVTASRSLALEGSAFAMDVKVPVAVTKLPTISGTAKVKSTLRAKVGSWTPKPTAYAYRWLRNGKAISGATKSSYKLTKSDRGRTVRVQVTAKKSGAASGVALSSSTKKVK